MSYLNLTQVVAKAKLKHVQQKMLIHMIFKKHYSRNVQKFRRQS